MKTPLISLFIILICTQVALAQNKCPSKPYDVSNSFSRTLQKYTGINFVSSLIAEKIFERHIDKHLSPSKVNVDLKIFSAEDLIAGKIKSFSVDITDPTFKKVSLSQIKAKSLCNFIELDYKKKPVKLKTPIYTQFHAVIKEKDLSKTSLTPKIKLKDLGVIHLNISKAKISKGRVIFPAIYNYDSSIIKLNIPMMVESSLLVEDNVIYLVDLKLPIDDLVSIKRLKLYDLREMKPGPYQLTLNKVYVANDRVNVEGRVYIKAPQQQDPG